MLNYVSNYMLLFQKFARFSYLKFRRQTEYCHYEDNFRMLHVETLKVVFISLVTDFLTLKTCPYATKLIKD